MIEPTRQVDPNSAHKAQPRRNGSDTVSSRAAFFMRIGFQNGAVANNGTKSGAQPNQLKNQNINEDGSPVWRDMEQVVEAYQVTRPVIYHWINSGLIESYVVRCTGAPGSGKRLINITSIERLIRNSPVKSSDRIARFKRKAGLASAASAKAKKLARKVAKRGRAKQ